MESEPKRNRWRINAARSVLTVVVAVSCVFHAKHSSDEMIAIAGTTPQMSYELAKQESFGFFRDITDENWKLNRDLYAAHVNHIRPENMVWRYKNPKGWYAANYEPNFTCPFERRVGADMNGDGPKWICDPHRIKDQASDRIDRDNSHPGCVVYSIGSNGDFNFELGMQEVIGEGICEFHIFDMGDFEGVMPQALKRAHYHQWGLKSEDSSTNDDPKDKQKFLSLKDTIKSLGHQNLDVIDVFKIDCEGCELETYRDWLQDGIPRLQQIQVEVHQSTPDILKAFFDTLEDAGYLRFHKEHNLLSREQSLFEYAFFKVEKSFMAEKIRCPLCVQI